MSNIKATDHNDVTSIRRSLHRNTDLAVLGQTSDASSPVFVNDRPGYWWVRFIQAGGTYGPPVQVRGCTIPMATTPGVPVKMGVVEGEKAVIGPDFVGLLSQGVNPTQNAVVDPNANNPAFVNQSFIATAFEQILEGTLKVGLRGAVPLAVGVFVKVEGQFDFTGNVPSAGSHCLAMTAIQSDLSTLETQYSTAKSTGIPLDLDDLNEAWALMSDPTTNKPLWSWDIGNGQTALIEANRWMDNRQFLNWESSGGGSGDVSGPGAVTVTDDITTWTDGTGTAIKDSGKAFSTDGTFAANSDALIPTQKAAKTYTDNAITQAVNGLNPKPEMYVWTNAALSTNSYSKGASGVGATLTAVGTGVLTVDGVAVPANVYIGVKDEVTQSHNGYYFVTVAGAIGVAYVLTRATFADTSDELIGGYAFTTQGTANKDKGFICSNVTAITIGTTAITYELFAAAGINQLHGDATAGPGTGDQAITFATVNSNVGTFSRVKSITANAKGLITAITQGLVDLASEVTGLLPLANGGTGADESGQGPGVWVQATNGSPVTVPAALGLGFMALPWKWTVKEIATVNVSVSSAPSTIDSSPLNSGDRCLLTAQTTGSENGIWQSAGSGNPMVRPADYPSGSTLHAYQNILVTAYSGATRRGALYFCNTTGTITIDTTSTAWSQLPPNFASSGQGIIGTNQGGTGVDLSSSGSATELLAQDASHVISARNLVAADIPGLPGSIITSGTVPAANLGTGTGATFSAAGTSGAVPQPQIKDNTKLLSGALTYIRAMITLYSQGADVVLTNPNTETTIIGTGLGSVTIPANNLNEVGRAFEIRAVGYVTRADSSTTRIRIKLGGTTLLDTTALTLAWGTSHRVEIYAKFTTKSTGSSGTINGQGYVDAFSAAGTFTRNSLVSTSATTEDLTGALAGDVTWLFSGSNAGNIVTITNLDIIQIAG